MDMGSGGRLLGRHVRCPDCLPKARGTTGVARVARVIKVFEFRRRIPLGVQIPSADTSYRNPERPFGDGVDQLQRERTFLISLVYASPEQSAYGNSWNRGEEEYERRKRLGVKMGEAARISGHDGVCRHCGFLSVYEGNVC